jgi:hypothetical protein
MARKQTPLVGPGIQRTPPARPASDTSSNLPVNPPQVGPVPDTGVNIPSPDPNNPFVPSQQDMTGRPGSLPVVGEAAMRSMPPTRPAPLRGSLPFRPASRLGR